MALYLSIPILAFAAILQASILPLISLAGGGPDLVFLIVLAWAIDSDLRQSASWAFVGGLMLDLLSSLPVGVHSIPLLVIVFALSGVGTQVYRLGLLLLVSVAVGGTLFQQLTLMILTALLGHRVQWVEEFTSIVLPTMFYNLLLIVPTYWLIRRIQRRIRRSQL
jgi:rod shape-determining protein MreD